MVFIRREQNPDGLHQRLCVRPLPVVTGVPQSSIFGPHLLIIYINVQPNCLKHCTTNMYADDTYIYVSARNKAAGGFVQGDCVAMC